MAQLADHSKTDLSWVEAQLLPLSKTCHSHGQFSSTDTGTAGNTAAYPLPPLTFGSIKVTFTYQF